MWMRSLSLFLRRLVKRGALVVVDPDGRSERYGEAASDPVTVRLHTRSLPRRLLVNPDLVLGEAYMDGALTVDGDDIYGLIELLLINLAQQPDVWHYRWLARLRQLSRNLAQFNPAERARRNVAHHYDLSGALYDLILDADRQYSCGYFRHPGDNLEAAQQAKKTLIATKLLLKPGQRVLDIGCGWGGLGLQLARDHGARVTGVTLSREQHRIAEARARTSGLADRVRFRLQDYRQVEESFDRVVSVGMFEHVGVPHYREFFDTLRQRLSEDGVALLHTIGRADGPSATNPWLAKYIFPGGYSPALSELLAEVERSGLYVTDIEIWRLHYAETLQAWRLRFEAELDRVREIYDERFCRMWRFYLVISELAFRQGGHVVFQIQLARKQDAVPLTRDYLALPEIRDDSASKAA
ncbi:cyclopropane-fatty-acyl-phospholipid synthase family protein [Aurantimonas sp. A3-2-R12]|uniref:cyclopropane-fatty-acyl-phospholipid synthase family protein n=1 Tax=Aurantimonas sp. A3-2-R12 TaxID=3114362 RepID=UPI002E171359|nr:cyclopropane-fatty-acyl-phospholipid synthase family protein [Aurantimonas sp. A3-2-R12]